MHYWSYCCRRHPHHYHNWCHPHSPYHHCMRGSSMLAAFWKPTTLLARLCLACKAWTCRRVRSPRHVGAHEPRLVAAARGDCRSYRHLRAEQCTHLCCGGLCCLWREMIWEGPRASNVDASNTGGGCALRASSHRVHGTPASEHAGARPTWKGQTIISNVPYENIESTQ